MLFARALGARYAHARGDGLLVDVQPAAPLDHSLHGVTSRQGYAGARRSVLITTLLGVLDGNNAGSRKLPRQFCRGLAIPNHLDVSERAAPANDSRIFIVQGGPSAHHHFVGLSVTCAPHPCGAERAANEAKPVT